MTAPDWIASPDHPRLDELCAALAERAVELDRREEWPAESLRLCAEYGVFRWFLPADWGGCDWSEAELVRGYLRLSAACLTTTFIITQRTGACLRILHGASDLMRSRWLTPFANGEAMATVGISHLTTSRRHLAAPVLKAAQAQGGFVLDGYSPWVTGADRADVIVTGATLPDDRQLLVALPADAAGVEIPEPPRLVGLSGSRTGEVRLHKVFVPDECLLAGPAENVMRVGVGAGTGGLQTSTLAVGLAGAAIDFLEQESLQRSSLAEPAASLRADHGELERDLLALAEGAAVCSNEDLRVRANSLVLRATQAALAAAKGAGYVVGHPAGRWCREGLFFLVWSCPQPVMAANLCELAGLD